MVALGAVEITFGAMLAVEHAAEPEGQEALPVPLEDLHRAIGPAEALLAILHEAVGNQATPEAAVHVDRMITGLEQAQPELGILADAPLGPAADAGQVVVTGAGRCAR